MADQRPLPAGFGNCPRCAYRNTGSPAFCFSCALKTFARLAANRCERCERALDPSGICGNPVCKWTEDERYFTWVWAISMRTGALRHAIDLYKVDTVEGWAWIFGRVLVGYLNAHRDTFERYDLIIPSPTYMGSGGRTFDHTAKVIERAIVEDTESWPFQLEVVIKAAPTKAFRGRTWPQRHAIATGELRNALVVPNPEIVKDKRILVYDDVYTEGLTLREVARALRNVGAIEVSEIVLARQPYMGQPA